MSKMSLRLLIKTSLSAVSDPQILKLIQNERLVRIKHWMAQQSNTERISQTQINPDILS